MDVVTWMDAHNSHTNTKSMTGKERMLMEKSGYYLDTHIFGPHSFY